MTRKASYASLPVILIAYAAAAAFLLPLTRWQLNPDGVSYIAIARRLLEGDFRGAISAHWSPLFSWILLPLLRGGVEPLLACKVLTYLIGAMTMSAFWSMSALFTSDGLRRAIVTATFGASVLMWASSLITPDLLLVCVLLIYIQLTLRTATTKAAALAGAASGVAYLAKSYALPFFLAHFTMVQFVRWWRASAPAPRREIVLQFCIGMLTSLAITLPWIAVISIRYGHVTMGSAGSYNWHLVEPSVGGRQPVKTDGLIAPPDANALSIWDDPSLLRFPPWTFDARSVALLARHILDNIIRILGIIESWSLFAIPILVAAIRRIISRSDARMTIAFALASAALYTAGFLALLLEARYLWIVYALLLLIALALFDDRQGRAATLLFVLVVVSFAFPPLLRWRLDHQGLVARRQADDLQRQRVELSGHRIASNRNWESTLYLNYFVRGRYYGTPKPRESSVEIRRELDREHIDAFVLWGGIMPSYLDGFRRVFSDHAFVLYMRD